MVVSDLLASPPHWSSAGGDEKKKTNRLDGYCYCILNGCQSLQVGVNPSVHDRSVQATLLSHQVVTGVLCLVSHKCRE